MVGLSSERREDDCPYTISYRTIVKNRLQDPVGMNRKVELAIDDPRRVSAVLAPTIPPPTVDPVAQKNLDLLLMIKIKLLTIVVLISHPFWQGLCIDKNCCFITRSCVSQNVVLQLCSYKLF